MHNFYSPVPIDLNFLPDIPHYKVICWIKFGGCIFWLGVGVTTKTVKKWSVRDMGLSENIQF